MAALRKIGNKFIQNIIYGRQEPSTELETDSGYGSAIKDETIKENTASSLLEAARSSGKHSPRLKKAKSMGFLGIGSFIRTATWFSHPADDLSPSSPVSPRYPHFETPKKHRSTRNRLPSSLSWSGKKSKGSSKKRRAAIPEYEQDRFHSPLSHRNESPTDATATAIAKHVETLQSPLDAIEAKKGLDAEKIENLPSTSKKEVPQIARVKHIEKSQIQLKTIVKADKAPDVETTEDLPSISKKEIRPQLLWPHYPNPEGDNDDPYVESKKRALSAKLDPLASSLKTTIQEAFPIVRHNPTNTNRLTNTMSSDGSSGDDDSSIHDNVLPYNPSDLQEHVQDKKIARSAFKDESSDFVDDRRSLPSYLAFLEAEETRVKAKVTFEAGEAENQTSPTAIKWARFSNSDDSLRSSLIAEDGYEDSDGDTGHGLEVNASPSSEPSMGPRTRWESSRAERAKRYADIIVHDDGSGFPPPILDGTTKGSKSSPLRYAIEAIERPSSLELDKEFQKGAPLSNVAILKDHGKQLLEKAREPAERNNRIGFDAHDKHGNPPLISNGKSETVIALEKTNGVDSQSPTRYSTPKSKNLQTVQSSSSTPLPTPPTTPPEDKMVLFLEGLKTHTSYMYKRRNDKVTTEMAAQLARHRAQKLALEETMRVSSSSELEEEPALASSDDSKDASSCSSAPSDSAQRQEEDQAVDIDGDTRSMDSNAGEKRLDTDVGNRLMDSNVGKKLVDSNVDRNPVEPDAGDVNGSETGIDDEKKQNLLKRLTFRKEGRIWRRTVAQLHRDLYDCDSDEKKPPVKSE